MRNSVFVIILLVIAGVVVAGCQSTAPAAPPAETVIAATTEPTAAPQTSFELGNHYLEKKYSFYSEKDLFTEQFHVPNGQPWGVEFHVIPTNENLQYCWFEMTLTNMNTGQKETFGYGRENGFEKDQLHAMYDGGPYQLDMKGNRVSVQVKIAERIP